MKALKAELYQIKELHKTSKGQLEQLNHRLRESELKNRQLKEELLLLAPGTLTERSREIEQDIKKHLAEKRHWRKNIVQLEQKNREQKIHLDFEGQRPKRIWRRLGACQVLDQEKVAQDFVRICGSPSEPFQKCEKEHDRNGQGKDPKGSPHEECCHAVALSL